MSKPEVKQLFVIDLYDIEGMSFFFAEGGTFEDVSWGDANYTLIMVGDLIAEVKREALLKSVSAKTITAVMNAVRRLPLTMNDQPVYIALPA
jgi:hypothetical protein